MKEQYPYRALILLLSVVLLTAGRRMAGATPTITPSPYWKNQISFPSDVFCARGISKDSAKWVKFTILLSPYDSNIVYFQDSRTYVFHYDFAVACLDPFAGMTQTQLNAVTMFEQNQRAIMGSVIMPPTTGMPPQAAFNEYGIQFVREDPYTKEQIRDLFNLVKACVAAPSDVRVFYFPTYEQQAVAAVNQAWFESQGMPLGSAAQWEKGNICCSEGWSLGQLKFFSAGDIAGAYQQGQLTSSDILLTDGIPAELPFVSGIVSLVPGTPNSHVALLTSAYNVPFAYVALADDSQRARDLIGHRIIFSVYVDSYGICDVRLIDGDGVLDANTITNLLKLKQPAPLNIVPMTPYGAFGVSCDGLTPSDICHVGGKAANFGLLRQAVPANSPRALALTFDLWNAFLGQQLPKVPRIDLAPGGHFLIWADGNPSLGPAHASFKLSKDGECVALYDANTLTLIDWVQFGPQSKDVSYGRSVDGGGVWQYCSRPTPGGPNSSGAPQIGKGLVINELEADNKKTIENPDDPGHHPDWIELYNASQQTICLNGLYVTDDMNNPTRWRIPPMLSGGTLRQEIAGCLSVYPSYPPANMQNLCNTLASIRSLFTDGGITVFTDDVLTRLWGVLTDPKYGLDPNVMLRFRSSTNVEDTESFMSAGLYDSFSGCLAEDLCGASSTCNYDPHESGDKGVLQAIRKAFASFYNDDAYLERLRHNVSETQVGMALLVHPSFPDEIELANGVATVEKTADGAACTITLVSQTGAVSVTNPPVAAASPETVTIHVVASGCVVPPKLVSASGLLPLGGTVMTWPADYKNLGGLLLTVNDAFQRSSGKTSYLIDMEYKKMALGGAVLPAGGLVIKQVREIPEPNQAPSITPFLIDVPTEFEVFPGEFEVGGTTDVFADHRLKSRWTLETHNMVLDANGLRSGLYGKVTIEHADGDGVHTLSVDMASLPLARHTSDGKSTSDSWALCDLVNPCNYCLQTPDIATAVSAADNPIFTPTDLGDCAFNLPYRCLTLSVKYDNPVLSWFQNVWPTDPPSRPTTTQLNRVYLWPRQAGSADDIHQEQSISLNGIAIKVSFYYPPAPTGYPDWTAHTAPLKRWDQTTIEGLTTKPIVLNGYYSRTYRPEHHNLIENFLFEPRLEPGLAADILSELQNMDIRLIHLTLDNRTGGTESSIRTYGFAGPQ
jgi:hypothetical protein